MVEPPPLAKKLAFGAGSLGWSLASYAAGNLLAYFYMPPGTGGTALFPPRVYQGAVLGVFTVLGVVMGLGRVFDAVTDPLVASWSDRSRARLGRRVSFMAVAALPFALFSVLVFVPVTGGVSLANAVWLGVAVFLFYVFMTMYIIPHYALLSELGFLLGKLPVPAAVHLGVVVLAAAGAGAIFGILPNAITADLAEADAVRSGSTRPGCSWRPGRS